MASVLGNKYRCGIFEVSLWMHLPCATRKTCNSGYKDWNNRSQSHDSGIPQSKPSRFTDIGVYSILDVQLGARNYLNSNQPRRPPWNIRSKTLFSSPGLLTSASTDRSRREEAIRTGRGVHTLEQDNRANRPLPSALANFDCGALGGSLAEVEGVPIREPDTTAAFVPTNLVW